MPNWCDNTVTLRHPDKSKIDALEAELNKKDNEGYRFNGEFFNHLRPNPSGEWQYDWSCENWGSKWDASIIDANRNDDNEIWVSFDSAWSPPTALYEYLVAQGWDVDAIYYEPGMGYGGIFTTEGGDDYYEFDWTSREEIENLPSDLIEFGDLLTRFDEYLVERLEEEWADAERTEWIDVKVKPIRDGWYEVTTEAWEFPQFREFKNGDWDSYNKPDRWRGLAEEPNETEVG